LLEGEIMETKTVLTFKRVAKKRRVVPSSFSAASFLKRVAKKRYGKMRCGNKNGFNPVIIS
jgi:hypothetical protein